MSPNKERPTKKSDIDWNYAFEKWNEVVEQPDKTKFIEAVLPLAPHMASRKAKIYRGKRLGAHIDEDACLEAAMDGLLQVAKKRRRSDGTDGEWLERQCTVVIARRLHDLEREVIGRGNIRKRDIVSNMMSLNHGYSNQDDEADMSSNISATQSPHEYDMRMEEMREHLMRRIRRFLSRERYEITQAVATLSPLGYNYIEIASHIGKSPGNVNSTMQQVRAELKKHDPSIEKELRLIIGEGSDKNMAP